MSVNWTYSRPLESTHKCGHFHIITLASLKTLPKVYLVVGYHAGIPGLAILYSSHAFPMLSSRHQKTNIKMLEDVGRMSWDAVEIYLLVSAEF